MEPLAESRVPAQRELEGRRHELGSAWIEGAEEAQAGRGLGLSAETAVKFFILRSKSINPQKEIRDQLDEIQREKWIRGVREGSEPDPQAVAADWASRHSACWREHRVTTIVYVFEREKQRYCGLLD